MREQISNEHRCPRCKTRFLSKDTKTPAGKQRWVCRHWDGAGGRIHCYSTTDPTKAARNQRGDPLAAPKQFRRKLTGQRFLVTAAQNATPVHAGFMKALEACAKHLEAELIVIPLRYKNPTSRWTASQENQESWAPEVVKYLCNERKKLNKNLVLLGDIKVQPTAAEPLMGFDAITHGESGILGHTKLQLRTIPTPQGKLPKLLTTTGACTVANYTDSRAGALGAFHHTLGAVIVEIDGPIFHMRQINGSKTDGSFYDLDKIYGADWVKGGIADAPRPLALVMGDTHVGSIEPGVQKATDDMIAFFRPENLVWHDLFDGYAINHHHNGNVFQAYAKHQSGKGNVAREVRAACEHVNEHTPAGCKSTVVASNHDDFLRRWIINEDWREDEENAEFYLQTALQMLRTTKAGPSGMEVQSPFAYWMGVYTPDARVLGGRESFTLGGIELGLHGDRGPNGVRGSARNLRRIGVKSIIGHSHSPQINEGCYQVGTSTRLELEYNSGPSSWLNTHCLVYANGKRTLINVIGGEWKL